MDKRLLLLRGGMVEPMTGAGARRADILCGNGKIERISERVELPESAAVRILDASGCLVLPGLIDAHCHVGVTEEKKGTEGDDCNENTEPVMPWLRGLDAVNMMDAAFGDAVRAGITSVMTGPGSSNPVGGQFVLLKTSGRRADEAALLAPAAMKVAFGENPKANFSGMGITPVTRMGIAGLLRRELFAARAYCRERAAGRGEEKFELEPWRPVFERKIPLKAHVHRVDDIFTAMRIAEEFGLDMTLDHCSEGHLIADHIARSRFPAIVGPDLTCRNKIEVQNMNFKTAGVLYGAGVPVAICTDHPVSLISCLPLCAGLAVKAGLPMRAGLQAITSSPAKICRVFHRVGSLEEGKDADIAVFSGNPMETFTVTRYTIIDGEVEYRG